MFSQAARRTFRGPLGVGASPWSRATSLRSAFRRAGPAREAVAPPGLARRLSSVDKSASMDFLRSRSRSAGLRLSRGELESILGLASKDGRLAATEWESLVSRKALEASERVTFSEYLAKSHDHHIGQQLLRRTAKMGVAFFALTGAHTAGLSGMHVVGASIVGAVTALGGGTFNNLVTGTFPVGWARDHSFLRVALLAALFGFYAWPLVEDHLQLGDDDKKEGGGREKRTGGGGGDAGTKEAVRAARYALETGALGALAVVGAQQGILKGFHPLVSATLGVTIAFGGVVRDLMCHRELALGANSGAQSYGVASLAGASVYVGLRELHVWNCAGDSIKLVTGGIPISLRILAGFSAACAVRVFAYDKPLFHSMAESVDSNRKLLEKVAGQPPST